jgi:hypothetical protein
MTVSTGDAKAGPYTGNDSASAFAFAFKVFADTDIRVVSTVIATNVESDLVLNTNYTVARNADQDSSPGGTVTYKVGGVTTALPSTHKLTIVGDFTYEQPTDIPNGGAFFASVVEASLDRLTLLVKQVKEKLDRAVVTDVSSATDPSLLLGEITASVAAAGAAEITASVAAAGAAESAAGAAQTAAEVAQSAAEAAAAAAGAAESASVAAANPYGFDKLDSRSVAFTKTAAGTISIKAGTEIMVAGVAINIAVATPVVMPALTAGTDYAIYACTDGTVRADASFTAPTGYTTANSRMIGGFHYGLTAPGTTVAGGSFATTGNGMIWTQTDVDLIAGINAFSLWDLKWRPLCDPKGMALVAGRTWVDIYLCGTNHTTNGTSKAGTDIASGTVLPKKPLEFGGNGTVTYATPMWWDFVEIANAYKKRLLREQEFVLAAFGVTENQSIDSTAATYPTTQRNAGYTSKYGLEQASGHHYTWGEDTGMYYDNSTWTWKTSNGGRGQILTQGTYGLARVILGGPRANGVYSGSRCSTWVNYPRNVNWNVRLKDTCDHQDQV